MPTKQANPTVAEGNAALRGAALDDILAVAGLAAAGGVGARGLLGLRYMFGRKRPDLQRTLGPTVLSVPAPVYASSAAATAGHKAAGYALYKQAIEKRAEGLLTSRSEIPWYLPGITLAGVGGLAGGYKLMDVLMDRKRKADLQADLQDARAQYRAALLSQYDPAAIPGPDGGVLDLAPPAKTVNPQPGAAKPLALKAAALQADLDTLYDKAAQQVTARLDPQLADTVANAAAQATRVGDAAGQIGRSAGRVGDSAAGLMDTVGDFMPAFAAAGLLPAAALGGGLLGGAYARPGRFGQGAVRGAMTGMGAVGGGLLGQLAGGPIGAGVGALGGGALAHLLAGRSPYVDEKHAAEKAAMPGWAGKGLGIYATLASLLALGSGTAAYNFTRARSSSQLVEKALKDRERERWNRRPPEIYAVPQPVRVRYGDVTPTGAMKALPGVEGG